MKRIVCLTMILCFLLAGCGMGGRVRSPFLTESERKTLEQSLSDSLRVTYTSEDNNQGILSLQNRSNYRLTDVMLVDLNESLQLLYLPDFPAGGELSIRSYCSDGWETVKNHRLSMDYTIGDYSYYTEDITAEITQEENMGIPDLKLSMNTIDGEVSFGLNETREFTLGNEIDGVSSARVYSVTAECNYSSYERKFNSLTLLLEGREPSGYADLIVKLIDENGIVRSASSAYFSDGTANVYLSCDLEPELLYRLQFLELD